MITQNVVSPSQPKHLAPPMRVLDHMFPARIDRLQITQSPDILRVLPPQYQLPSFFQQHLLSPSIFEGAKEVGQKNQKSKSKMIENEKREKKKQEKDLSSIHSKAMSVFVCFQFGENSQHIRTFSGKKEAKKWILRQVDTSREQLRSEFQHLDGPVMLFFVPMDRNQALCWSIGHRFDAKDYSPFALLALRMSADHIIFRTKEEPKIEKKIQLPAYNCDGEVFVVYELPFGDLNLSFAWFSSQSCDELPQTQTCQVDSLESDFFARNTWMGNALGSDHHPIEW